MPQRPAQRGSSFVLYVEGARDRDILRAFARRLSPRLASALEPCTVILGGRRPKRALQHFRDRGGAGAGLCGLIVLDRDDQHVREEGTLEAGLEVFTWGRRHIESYVMVRSAIARVLNPTSHDPQLDRLIAQWVPADDDEAMLPAPARANASSAWRQSSNLRGQDSDGLHG